MSEITKKISQLNQGTPLDTDIVPYVDLVTNTTKKALKSELKGDKGDTGDNATVDAGTTTTLSAGESATVTNVGTTSDAIFNFAIPQGIQGLTGDNGACVESVSFVGNDMVFVLDDASTVTLTNAKTDLKGDTGAKIVSGAFVGDDLVFTLDDNSTVTITGAKTDLQGDKGDTGDTGNGIDNIAKTGTVGLVDTYTITYTDTTTDTFDVTNGADGVDGDDGISFIWKGAYVAETTYQVNDVVSYNGSTYICVLESTGNLPTNTTYWSLMAQKGTDGTGSGDMTAAVYDPTSVEGDAFDMDNMAQGTTNKFISDAQFTVLSNTSGTNTGDVTVTDSDEIDFTLSGQDITASLKAGSIDETKLDTSVNDSLGKADSALQENDNISLLTNNSNFISLSDILNSQSTASASSITPAGNYKENEYYVTALAADLTINAPSGTASNGNTLMIRIKDNGTSRTLTFNEAFVAVGVTLPPATTINKVIYIGAIYNSTSSKWEVVSINEEE